MLLKIQRLAETIQLKGYQPIEFSHVALSDLKQIQIGISDLNLVESGINHIF
jgi:hypothetical protein